MNNTKDWEEYRKDVSNSEKVGEYIANMIDHDERERLKYLLDICEKSKDSSYDLPIDCKIYLPLVHLLFPHQRLDFMMWADKMGYLRCEEDKIVIISSMIKRRFFSGSLKIIPEMVEAFALYRKHVG
ncbi:hypothetical protein NXY33_22450 [Bacteroides fragilis]|nr:hypothetical protein [Bacteroides fragilis]